MFTETDEMHVIKSRRHLAFRRRAVLDARPWEFHLKFSSQPPKLANFPPAIKKREDDLGKKQSMDADLVGQEK